MAERSTAAVDVADNSGDKPLTAKADEATTDGTAEAEDTKGASAEDTENTDGGQKRSEAVPASPDLHSGHKLAGRYRLEECVTRLDGFSSWR
ncbi:serine/threonine protein kinase, partial [Streptomyces sp. SID7982]|nr:serine/threonine protein kinase [Streptomyces sp. SID7982]